jgi:uncharacterized membrane protein
MRRSLMSSKHLFILARRLRSNKGFITFLYWWVLDIGGSSICGGIVGTMFISVISIWVFLIILIYFVLSIPPQIEEPPMSRTHQYRKVMKPLLERKRRARINKCLDDIKDLLIDSLQRNWNDKNVVSTSDIIKKLN